LGKPFGLARRKGEKPQRLNFFSSLCLRALHRLKGGAPKHFKALRAGLAIRRLIAQLNG
jgi:hypothetical protein